MTRNHDTMLPGLRADPFGVRSLTVVSQLLRLVDITYAEDRAAP